MKKIIIILATIALSLGALGIINKPVQAETATNTRAITFPATIETVFPDAGAASHIARTLYKQVSDTVTEADLAGIEKLIAGSNGIVDLTGFEYLTGATEIYIADNNITDLSPLSGLTQLQSLLMSNNKVSDLTPLSGLTNLTAFHALNNEISDVTPLQYLTNLEILLLTGNKIQSIDPLATLTNLTRLTLSGNQITDISAIQYMTKMGGLDLDYNYAIVDISPLANLPVIRSLHINMNSIVDISPLANLTTLENLSMGDNYIADISALENLTNIWILYMERNKISDISPIAGMTNLERLYIHRNQIADLSPLNNMHNLVKQHTTFFGQEIHLDSVLAPGGILNINNIITNRDGNLIAPTLISDDGTHIEPVISWTDLTDAHEKLFYHFSYEVHISDGTETFSGIVYQPVVVSTQVAPNPDPDESSTNNGGSTTDKLPNTGENTLMFAGAGILSILLALAIITRRLSLSK